jgi:hypothetical protein
LKTWGFWIVAVCIPGGSLIAAGLWLHRRWTADRVSSEWMQEQLRKSSRIDFQGVRISFPIKKLLNDSPLYTRHQEAKRRRA